MLFPGPTAPLAGSDLRLRASQVKPCVQGAVPSLTSQAATQVAIQALIRSDLDRGRGARPAGVQQVNASPSSTRVGHGFASLSVLGAAPARPSPARLALHRTLTRIPDCVQVSLPRPREARLEPRPSRRMFRASASQGVQGAARAALGGYSQAYGTVCHSALGHLPLLPGPHA